MKKTPRLTRESLGELGTDELAAVAGAHRVSGAITCLTIQIHGTRDCETLPVNQCLLSVLC